MVYINVQNQWINMVPEPNTVFVIRPGAGTFKNKNAYSYLEQHFNVVYFGQTGNKYDKYPDNWTDNKLVSTDGKHLGGLSQKVLKYILTKNVIPSSIIVGSRGGQVTLGKIWETIWRGPTVIINAGCLTTRTIIPQQATPLFITMEHDYFTSVNSPAKVAKVFDALKIDSEVNGYLIHLNGHGHMPSLNNDLKNLLMESVNFLINREFNIEDISIKSI